jgi:hypothetical protein
MKATSGYAAETIESQHAIRQQFIKLKIIAFTITAKQAVEVLI